MIKFKGECKQGGQAACIDAVQLKNV